MMNKTTWDEDWMRTTLDNGVRLNLFTVCSHLIVFANFPALPHMASSSWNLTLEIQEMVLPLRFLLEKVGLLYLSE